MRNLSLFISLSWLLFSSVSVSAQEVVATEELARNVSNYYGAYYATQQVSVPDKKQPSKWEATTPSLENRHSLQVGGGFLDLVLAAALDLFYDEGVTYDYKYPTLSNKLAEGRYYWTDERLVSSLTLDYGYRVKRWLALGVKGAVGFKTQARRHVGTNKLLYRDSRVVASLIFNMRFDWLHRRNVMMYSSFGVGAMSIFDFDNPMIIPMFDATFVGITLGRKFYGFAEVGCGASGSLRAGIGCRF